MKIPYLFGMGLCAAGAALAYPRSDLPSLRFEYKDWELACDNTRTCRAAGYTSDDAGDRATILLTRRAGPDQAVKVELKLADDPDKPAPPASLRMSVDARDFGEVRIDAQDSSAVLSEVQARVLLPALVQAGKPVWTNGQARWTVSGAGATAVLLKMDEFQGRIDTPGALVRKGGKPESSVLPALPVPVIRAAPVPPADKPAIRFTARQDRELLAELRKTSQAEACHQLDEHGKKGMRFAFARLSADKLLVAHPCWQGAYNSGIGYWVIAARPPYSPVPVTDSGSGYHGGTIESVQRIRGIGDCMAMARWVWDGRTFAQVLQSTSGMCREIAAGGAWELPTLTAQVRH